MLLSVSSMAQTATVNGTVRDAETGETLIRANIRVEGTQRGAATNTHGFYILPDLEPGEVVLITSHVGFEAALDTVEVGSGSTVRVDVELQPESLEEVRVEAEEPLEEERAVGLQSVSTDLVNTLPTVFEADLFRSLQLMPGIKAANDFSSKLYIRGGSPDQTLILLDQTTVYNPTHFFGFYSTFNTDAIKDARVYKGAYPAEYGGRLGSVIDVTNRDGNRNRLAGNVSVGLLASRALVEGPISFGGVRGAFMFAGRRSTLEPLLSVLRNNVDEEGIPDKFYFYDLNGKVTLDLSPNDRISVGAYAGRDVVAVPIGEDAQFDLDYGNQTLSVGYSRVLGPTVFASARATASRYVSTPVGEVAGTTFERPNRITDYSGRIDLDVIPSSAFELGAGLWGGYFNLNLESRFNGETRIDVEIPAPYASGYVTSTVRPGAGWILSGGVRGDYFRPGNYFRLSPQLKVERLVGDDLVLQLAGGRYHQFLSLISNEAFSAFDTWVTVGEGVLPQESEQVVLGVKSKLSSSWRFDAELYGRTMRNLFDIRPEVQDVSGLAYEELFRVGEGYAYGAELTLEKNRGRLTGQLGYTLGVTRRRYPDEPSYSDWFAPKYDRLHDLNLILSYDLGKGWKVTGVAVYSTGQAYTEPEGQYVAGGFPFLPPDAGVLVSSSLNNARLPAYHRVDVGFTRTGSFFGVGSYELQLQVVNVYSRRNLWFVMYDFDENPPEQTLVKQLPILPNVSFSISF